MSTRSAEIEVLMLAPAHTAIGGAFAVVRDRTAGGVPERDLALAEVSPDATVGLVIRTMSDRVIPVLHPIDPDLAVLIPVLSASLATWSRLQLELGEAAVVICDDANLARWLTVAALWLGGMPVVASTSQEAHLGGDLPVPICSASPDELVDSIRRGTMNRAGWTGIECTGRAEMLEVMLDSVPRWGRIALAGQSANPATIDFYNNVHRKGVRLSAASLSTAAVFRARENSPIRQFATRAAHILAHPALGARCRRLSTQPGRHA